MRIFALAGGRNQEGRILPGALAEVRDLHRRYAGVATADVIDPEAPEPLREYTVLHLAAHTAIDDQHPWRSGVLLASTTPNERRSAEAEPLSLRADRIAKLRLNARLAVLSGCESAGGRVLTGEGVLGLSSAFLSAGVPAVVASLWPVDDRATARLMERFYDGLARGLPAAGALRQAQSRVALEPGTRAPFYWAGFVLLGDGEVTVPLRKRQHGAVWAGAVLVVLLLAGAGLLPWLRRRRDVAPGARQ